MRLSGIINRNRSHARVRTLECNQIWWTTCCSTFFYIFNFLSKWSNPGLFPFIFGPFKQTIQFLQQLNVQKCHVYPVYSERIWTHDLSNISHLPLPLDQESRPFCHPWSIFNEHEKLSQKYQNMASVERAKNVSMVAKIDKLDNANLAHFLPQGQNALACYCLTQAKLHSVYSSYLIVSYIKFSTR